MSLLKRQGSAEKKMDQSSYTFTWRLPDFHKICPEGCEKFPVQKSPIFSGGDIDHKQLRWFVHLKGNEGKISCYLTLIQGDLKSLKEENRTIKCAFKFGLGNKKDPYHVTQSTEGLSKVFANDESSWGYACLLTISDLYKEKRDVVLQGNTLQLTVQLRIFGETVSVLSSILLPNPSICLQSIQKRVTTDYRQLFSSKKFSDVEIKCDDKTYYCHRNILQARSSVFCAMFDTDMVESKEQQVVIKDLKPQIMSALLLYIYTGTVELEGSDWTDLINGAEKYDLPELKNYCFEKLLEAATDDTIAQIAVTAYTYGPDEKIKEAINNYCQTHIGRLMENAGFRKLLIRFPGAFYKDLDVSSSNTKSPEQPD